MNRTLVTLSILTAALLSAQGTLASDDLNGSVSVKTLIRILKSSAVQKVVTEMSATVENSSKRLVFKGIQQSTGVLGRCMGCNPQYQLFFKANSFAVGFDDNRACTVTIEDSGVSFEIVQDECKGSGMESK